jgi:thiol:disulfide interchange protein DsbD
MKVTLGFVELAAAIKFLSNADLVWGWNLVSRPLAIAVTAVIFFLAGMYLIGKLRLKHEEIDATVGVPRLLAAIAFFGFGLYLIPGLFGAPLNSLDAFLPPRQATDVRLLGSLQTEGGIDDGWIVDDIDEALRLASVQERPVLVDFTGYTCTNCRQMESTVFPVPAVSERLFRDFVLLRLYTDSQETGDEFQRYQLRTTGTVALPTYAVLAPADGRLISKTSGLQSADRFSAFLAAGFARAMNPSGS